MAERVRRFRVKDNSGCQGCGVKVGDVSEYVRERDGAFGKVIFLKALPHWVVCNEPDGTHEIKARYLEELPPFAVGDAVRVKAGITRLWRHEYGCQREAIGKKLLVSFDKYQNFTEDPRLHVGYVSSEQKFVVNSDYLEPWNDAEEWDGSKWVPKKPVDSSHKPAIVCLREDGVLNLGCVFDYSSTNDAFASAEEMAKANPGKEYVVLQEKGSKRVEPKPSAAEAVAFAISGEIKDKHMSTWKFRNGTSFGVVPVRMNWDYESDEVTIRFRCHRPA